MHLYIAAAVLGEAASWFRRRKKMEFSNEAVRFTSFCTVRGCLNIGVHKIEIKGEALRLCSPCTSRYEDQCEREARRRQRLDIINQVFRLPALPTPKEFDFNARPAPEMYAWMSE